VAFIVYLIRQLKESTKATIEAEGRRVEDQRSTIDKLLELSGAHNDSIGAFREAAVAQKGAVTALEGAMTTGLAELRVDMRDLERTVRGSP
jgi:hypothetical protein